MKKYLIYFGFLFLIMILLYQLKITLGKNDLSKTNLSANPITEAFIAEIEILNGCGISGIAELYTNFLRLSKYDIISTDNAKDEHGKINFDYKNCKIIVNNPWNPSRNSSIDLMFNNQVKTIPCLNTENVYKSEIETISNLLLKNVIEAKYPLPDHNDIKENIEFLEKWSKG